MTDLTPPSTPVVTPNGTPEDTLDNILLWAPDRRLRVTPPNSLVALTMALKEGEGEW
jgi:hypothetical protein